jgi:hypothetical protein
MNEEIEFLQKETKRFVDEENYERICDLIALAYFRGALKTQIEIQKWLKIIN